MNNDFKIIGIYKIKSKELCYLLEMEVKGNGNIFDVGKVTQEISNEPRENWQAPYLEHILDDNGENIIADDLNFSKQEYWVKDKVRIVFFFHYLDFKKPLITPLGHFNLPNECKVPKRLEIIKYEPVD